MPVGDVSRISEHCPLNAQVLEFRVGALEEATREISQAVKTIAENTTQIALLEERHSETREAMGRAFKDLGTLNNRVAAIETTLPSLKKTSHWFDTAVLALLGLVLAAMLKGWLKL